MSIWQWADRLAPLPEPARVTLGEGNTPVIRSRRIGPAAGLPNLYLKLESCNPTGSYKDRFAAAVLSHMVAAGQTRCVATSSGNTGAALAAYAAAAGVKCLIAILETTPSGKLRQMLAYGAELVRVRGFGIDTAVTTALMDAVVKSGSRPGTSAHVSAYAYSPTGMNGVETIAHELTAQLGTNVGHVFCPAGGGGLTLAQARGFALQVERGLLAKSPRVECVQPAGNDTIATPLRAGADVDRALPRSETTVSGLQVPNRIDGVEVIRACRATGGTGHTVTDEDVWAVQARLAKEEGVFCEPAGAVALAGALKAAGEGRIDPAAAVVCLVTASGFKDPPSVERMIGPGDCPVADLGDFLRRLEAGS